MRSPAGVPIGTTTLRGLRIAPPPTVTTRDTSGLPKRTARHTASAVPTLCTLTPISADSLPAGISRPVTVVTTGCFSEPSGSARARAARDAGMGAAATRIASSASGLLSSIAITVRFAPAVGDQAHPSTTQPAPSRIRRSSQVR